VHWDDLRFCMLMLPIHTHVDVMLLKQVWDYYCIMLSTIMTVLYVCSVVHAASSHITHFEQLWPSRAFTQIRTAKCNAATECSRSTACRRITEEICTHCCSKTTNDGGQWWSNWSDAVLKVWETRSISNYRDNHSKQ